MKSHYAVGSVHGRFQPPHLDHLRYILKAKSRCDFLYVGIAQCDISNLVVSAAAHRHDPAANPFTFEERRTCIEAMLEEAGVSPDEFKVVEFPIEQPHLICKTVPAGAIFFTTVVEPWNEQKIGLLRSQGFTVEVLYRDQKEISGTCIRSMMLAGNPQWRKLVAPSVAALVDKYDGEGRLRNLNMR